MARVEQLQAPVRGSQDENEKGNGDELKRKPGDLKVFHKYPADADLQGTHYCLLRLPARA